LQLCALESGGEIVEMLGNAQMPVMGLDIAVPMSAVRLRVVPIANIGHFASSAPGGLGRFEGNDMQSVHFSVLWISGERHLARQNLPCYQAYVKHQSASGFRHMAIADKTRMTLTIDRKLKHQLTVLAARERRDISDQICIMLIAQMAKAPRLPMHSDNN
jgi:hypothetical protein